MSGILAYIREVIYLMGENGKRIPWLLILFLISSLLDLIGLGIIGPYLVFVTTPNAMMDGMIGQWLSLVGVSNIKSDTLVIISIVLVALFFTKMVAALYINWRILVYSRKCRVDLQGNLMQAYQRQPYVEYIQRNSAEYLKNIHDATGQYVSAVQTLLRILSDGLVSLMIVSYLAYTNIEILAGISLLLGTFLYVYLRMFRRKSRRYGELTTQAVHQIVQSIHEGMTGFKELRILGKESYFYATLIDGARRMSDSWAKATLIAMVPRFFLEFMLIVLVAFLVLATLASGEGVDSILPTIGVFALAALRLLPAVNLLVGSVSKLSFNRHAVSMLYRDLVQVEKYLKSDDLNSAQIIQPTSKFKELSLAHVGFHYPLTPEWALRDVSLYIKAGESIGIIGESGGGKTTLIDVMLGLLEPQVGMIAFNNTPLQQALPEWCSQVAYLPQEIFIIDATLRENIALGATVNEIDEVKIQAAISQAKLQGLISGLQNGLDTRLGERGVRLSGGQRQRVALARAFYFERNVLVLDEATSALDNETERKIVNEISQMKGSKTLIVVAHRLTTVQHCDRIYRLKGGRVVSVGTYAEVVGYQ
jgi:ATP-binding cassette, subfamily B, bacterial PglK